MVTCIMTAGSTRAAAPGAPPWAPRGPLALGWGASIGRMTTIPLLRLLGRFWLVLVVKVVIHQTRLIPVPSSEELHVAHVHHPFRSVKVSVAGTIKANCA